MIGEAFKEMGLFGKIVCVAMVAASVKECAVHISTTIRLRKEAAGK